MQTLGWMQPLRTVDRQAAMSTGPVTTIRCPGCGAPAPDSASRCEYCRSRLAAVSCPSCFGLLFDGAAFCPHCGAARSRVEGINEQRIRCSACTGEMRWVTVGATDLLECEQCDGTWLEATAFERLIAHRESQAAVLGVSGTVHRPSIDRQEAVRYRPCPRCGKLMNRINFGRLSGTIVDVCRGHGTFLDRGELHQVVRFIQQGGLDRSREAQRQELADERWRHQMLERTSGRLEPTAGPAAWNERWFNDFLSALFER
jgi:Zn-finger nucleic acid-binding protein